MGRALPRPELVAQPCKVRLEPQRIRIVNVGPAGRQQIGVGHELAQVLDQRLQQPELDGRGRNDTASPVDLVAAHVEIPAAVDAFSTADAGRLRAG